MQVAIVDYKAGNLRSVQRACHHVGIDQAKITADPDEILRADKVIFPGVGSAVSAVQTLHQLGLFEALTEFYRSGKPLLGICLGCQIVLGFTEEGDKECLGLVPGRCHRFTFGPESADMKVPHMGWNEISIERSHPLLAGVEDGDEFYFVHSYYTVPEDDRTVIARTEYGAAFCSILAKDNLFATQFHLEKSGKKGLAILAAFQNWDGSHVE